MQKKKLLNFCSFKEKKNQINTITNEKSASKKTY